ncbi:hypothetical protein EVAR_52060_1 [Eumeta japonica]|uniref:Uncharacterized protein n=1 Tax=Eumeta variegata TaxID=151549 RepID=A0A4C1Z8M1_EUMVA|nr:hypothetical protein EVAR_52060_1 [Eumeta japonica]
MGSCAGADCVDRSHVRGIILVSRAGRGRPARSRLRQVAVGARGRPRAKTLRPRMTLRELIIIGRTSPVARRVALLIAQHERGALICFGRLHSVKRNKSLPQLEIISLGFSV